MRDPQRERSAEASGEIDVVGIIDPDEPEAIRASRLIRRFRRAGNGSHYGFDLLISTGSALQRRPW